MFEENLIKYNQERRKAFLNGLDFEFNEDYEKILNSRQHKCNRIRNHIIYGLTHYDYAYFMTFTLDDKNINKCERSQRDAIKKCLSNKCDFILNVDYGSQTERKHYHVIAFSNECFIGYCKSFKNGLYVDFEGYNNGFSSCEEIKTSVEDIERLKKYINKLSNHTNKESTKNERVFYSFKCYENKYYDCNTKVERHFNHLENKIQLRSDMQKLGY